MKPYVIPSAVEVAISRAEALEAIPRIVDPLGKHWDQPRREDIEIDGKHALMSRATFLQLKEYSATNPTGVYVGKMWRRHDGLFYSSCPPRDRRWLLCWYGPSSDPRFCTINDREILLLDGEF